jgi:hypothetical protein
MRQGVLRLSSSISQYAIETNHITVRFDLAMDLPSFSQSFPILTVAGAEGGAIASGASSQPMCCCWISAIADRERMFHLHFFGSELTGPRSIRRLRRRGGDRGLAFADRAVEGRAFACRRDCGEAA